MDNTLSQCRLQDNFKKKSTQLQILLELLQFPCMHVMLETGQWGYLYQETMMQALKHKKKRPVTLEALQQLLFFRSALPMSTVKCSIHKYSISSYFSSEVGFNPRTNNDLHTQGKSSSLPNLHVFRHWSRTQEHKKNWNLCIKLLFAWILHVLPVFGCFLAVIPKRHAYHFHVTDQGCCAELWLPSAFVRIH